VSGNNVLQPAGIEARQQRRGRIVIQMTKRPADALLERRRIGALCKHIGIVIAFQYQRVTATEPCFDMRGDVTGVGEQTEPARAVGKHELAGLTRIVRHRVGMHGNGVDGKIFMSGEAPALREAACFRRAECGVRPGREPNRNTVLARQRADAVDVIAVFVGDQDGVQFTGFATETRETAFSFFQRKAAVHQDRRLPAFDQQPVAAAAAAEQGEAQMSGAARP
jgi:hypothetical protein